MHVEFYEKGCKSFFKKHNKQKDTIVKLVEAAIDKEVASGMTKVKLATRKRVNDKNIYEFRLNAGTIGSIRIAFSIFDKKAIVYFISKNIQKSAFSKDFEKIISKL
ncbi:hypothetical protein QP391_05310 [Lactobacillus paragasseri]|uniref:hypothetical protein n=1 Tax=Lactobacillus paragasseri TaxID=2107999 RepID=UPI00254CE7E7|nr:hypothetical protein [Lactobacillus paragasseri]MDK7120674.1 hypothetical protein [Lactobacillus paragasseri]